MKEITILSGKGGTGKTSVTAALASVAQSVVFCDNDVDAADLHLILNPDIKEQHTFISGATAQIDPLKCSGCGICESHCRFDAITQTPEGAYNINPFLCEGCKLCERVCPEAAITSTESDNNNWYISDTRFGTLVHASMGPGEENSGKLVTTVRKKAAELAAKENADFILNDGPPGIGCTAISALTGTQVVVIVFEPSKSAWHDAKRLIELVETFNIKCYAIINKFDINKVLSLKIEAFLQSKDIEVLAKIPFDKNMVEAISLGKSIVEYMPASSISTTIKSVWDKLQQAN